MQTNKLKLIFKKFFLIIFLPFNLLIDVILILAPNPGSSIALFRGVVDSLILILVFTFFNRKLNNVGKLIILFSFYCIIQIPFSSNFDYSLRITTQVLISMLTYFIGYFLVNSNTDLKMLNLSIINYSCILLINYFISSVFKLGSAYIEDIRASLYVGNLSDNWNNFSYAILILTFIFTNTQKKSIKYISIILASFLFIITLASMKRIAIIVVFVGLFIYYYISGLKKMNIKYLLIFFLITLGFYINFENTIIERFFVRQDRYKISTIEEEARYMETFFVWEEILSFQNPLKSIFGLQAFNSIGNYAGGSFGKRQLHVDYNLIVNTLGLMGLFLYLLIYLHLFKNNHLYNKYKIKNIFNKSLIALYFTLLITSLLTSFAGQMYSITFRSIIFIYLGAVNALFAECSNY